MESRTSEAGGELTDVNVVVRSAHHASLTVPLEQVMHSLLAELDEHLIAQILRVKTVGTLRSWATGKTVPKTAVEVRARELYRVIHMLQTTGAGAAETWLRAHNPEVHEFTPIELILSGQIDLVLRAASAWVVTHQERNAASRRMARGPEPLAMGGAGFEPA